ncbi:MAG: hypothetical protein U0269_02605 [Polyangiales bacterium]
MSDARGAKESSGQRFTRRPDGVIIDHESGLEWLALSSTRNWDELHCEPDVSLRAEGWRIPKRAELQTLVAGRKNADRRWLDPIFEGVANASRVWTDDWGDSQGVVWAFDFERGKAVEDWTHPTHHLGVFLLRETR